MPRPNRLVERRTELLPVLAAAFAELGYRRATTFEIAQRCGVGENILYRLWPDKKAMFLAALDYVYLASQSLWQHLLGTDEDGAGAFERLLAHESKHHGEHRLYRIVFAGLSETDDPEIRAALRSLYGRFHAFVREQLAARRGQKHGGLDPALAAWAIVGLGTVANLGRELGLLSGAQRRRLFTEVGRHLGGRASG